MVSEAEEPFGNRASAKTPGDDGSTAKSVIAAEDSA
jgi:hypothetical protein